MNLNELWPKMTTKEQLEYAQKHRRGICPYCGEETALDKYGQLYASHIQADFQKKRRLRAKVNAKEVKA